MATNKKKPKKSDDRPKPVPKEVCFVMMPFEEPFVSYFKAIIKPAIESSNLDPRQGDSLFRSSPIMADIWQMIQDAKIIIAVLTGKNPNVFYEMGLAHAIGKPIILISETMIDVPFDLHSLRVILYNKNNPSWGAELKTKILSALEETIQKPVEAVPHMFRKIAKNQAPDELELSTRVSNLEQQLALLNTSREGNYRYNKDEYLRNNGYLGPLNYFLPEHLPQVLVSSPETPQFNFTTLSPTISDELAKKYGDVGIKPNR